jgi:hypothetical protein
MNIWVFDGISRKALAPSFLLACVSWLDVVFVLVIGFIKGLQLAATDNHIATTKLPTYRVIIAHILSVYCSFC